MTNSYENIAARVPEAVVQDRTTCPLPAVTEITGVLMYGKYKKPELILKVAADEVPIAIWEIVLLSWKLVDVLNPAGTMTGLDIIKFEDVKSWA